jgi:hypothetical protein
VRPQDGKFILGRKFHKWNEPVGKCVVVVVILVVFSCCEEIRKKRKIEFKYLYRILSAASIN